MKCESASRPPPEHRSAIYKRIGHQLIVIVSQWLLQCCVVCTLTKRQDLSTMQTSTIVVLACLIVVVAARAHQELAPEHESLLETPAHDSSPRQKRGLLLLKKKLILGALGLKAAKVGAIGVAGALALKAKKSAAASHTVYHHGW